MWKAALCCTALAALLAPNGGRESRNDGCIIEAPVNYVREKVLDYRFMSQLQATTENPHLVVPFLSQSKLPATPAMETEPRSAINAIVGDILILGPQREATVTQNSPHWFSFKEQLPLLQRVAHTMEFSQFRDNPNMTVFQHERRWRGSLLIYYFRRSGVATSSGDGWWGGVSSLENAGTELIRRAVNEAHQKDSKGSIF